MGGFMRVPSSTAQEQAVEGWHIQLHPGGAAVIAVI
jgi:hypothetical protein